MKGDLVIGPVWVKELDRLRAEVASLKEHNEHLLHETVKMAADVAAIQREHDVQKTRLYAEKRALTQQLADSEATVKALRAALEHTENKLIEVSEQVKSEDARDAARLDWIQSEVDTGGMFALEKFGASWVKLFTASTQHMKQKPSVRAAIDAAIYAQESKK